TLNFVTGYSYDNYDATSGLTFTNVTDPNSVATKQGYDQFGRLRKSVDGLTNTTSYGYTRDLLTSITDANGYATSYEYDALKRLSATVFPDTRRETYAYRADGLLGAKTDRKLQTITYEYDRHKRLSKKTYPNSSYIQYTYTGQKLTQVYDNAVSPAETHTFSYDDRYRVTSETQGPRGTLTTGYDVADRRISLAVAGGPTAGYSYYADGSTEAITWTPVTGQFEYTYDRGGKYETITSPNGQTRSYEYDLQGRLLQLANAHPTTGNLATFNYAYDLNHATGTYDRLGQRVSMTQSIPAQSLSSALTKYRYDAAYQLTQAEYPAGTPFNGETHSWTYDAIGNRLTNTVNSTTTNLTYQMLGANPNNWQRLTNDGVNAYTYDYNGNTLTEGGNTFGWDYEDRMTSISGGATVSYKFDYQGRRTSKTVGGTTTTYLYDGQNLIGESGANYLYGAAIDEPLATDRGGAISNYAADGLGSIAHLGDSAGGTKNSYTYDTWGSARSSSELVVQPFRYTAREVGDITNQLFYRARSYAPAVGRFLSEDPLRFLEDANFYRYVRNAPLLWRDPSGLRVWRCWRFLDLPVTGQIGGAVLYALVSAAFLPSSAMQPGNSSCATHEFLVDDSPGGGSVGSGPGNQTYTRDARRGALRCEEVPEAKGKCAIDNFDKTKGSYHWLANNCHDAVQKALDSCDDCGRPL
ncbi:MAG TPA: RHS repeat-associated core domain-containing protein, partial [Thermoanaerobaculia bacterium]|nr:RHS repeat-associated core domain-containing protein [Thermoanaerobaculia bacterium]